MSWHKHEGKNRHLGIMDAPVCINVLEKTLLPFLRDVYPDGHCFMQDNNPKHASTGRCFLKYNEVTWCKTPPESPDLNPIENMWHELRRKVKPRIKDESWSVEYRNSGVQCLAS